MNIGHPHNDKTNDNNMMYIMMYIMIKQMIYKYIQNDKQDKIEFL